MVTLNLLWTGAFTYYLEMKRWICSAKHYANENWKKIIRPNTKGHRKQSQKVKNFIMKIETKLKLG